MIGNTVTVKIDRPMGSYHPKHKDMYYPINYGYIEEIIAPDGEEQDAYLLGVDEPVPEYTGVLIAIIHRYDDVEEKWVVAPEGMMFTKEEIESDCIAGQLGKIMLFQIILPRKSTEKVTKIALLGNINT